MSNYHGCKGVAINLKPHYMIDIIYIDIIPKNDALIVLPVLGQFSLNLRS